MATGQSRWRKDSGHRNKKPHLSIEGLDTSAFDEEDIAYLSKLANHTDIDGRPRIPEEDLEAQLADLEYYRNQSDCPDAK
jgi:hypothetical protein